MSIADKKITWISIDGNAHIGSTEIRFEPNLTEDETESPQDAKAGWTINRYVAAAPHAFLASSKYFQRGRIDFELLLGGPQGQCQFILNRGSKTQIVVGFNVLRSAYGIVLNTPASQPLEQPKWEMLAAANIGGYAPADRLMKARIDVHGSNVSLSVDDVIVASARVNVQIARTQLALYLEGYSSIAVKNISVVAESPRAFIVMQFKEPYESLYREVIKPVCEDFNFEVIRGDDIYSGGLIIKEITQSIQEASIVIADITPNNQNVYYELGYAHGLDKPTILLSDRTQEKLPFDISGFRTLFYENSIGGKRKVEESLRKHLASVTGQYD